MQLKNCLEGESFMKTERPVKPKHAPLLGLFLNGYEHMRQKMDEPCRRPLLDIAPLAFGKWYYTALANETILSPANILGLDFQTDADNTTEYAYVMRTKPAEEQPDEEFVSEYNFTLHVYSTEEHPIVEDLMTLIDFCTPDRVTDEHGLLLEKDAADVMEHLSMNTPFYLEYLTRLAWLHGLLVPMPSIHTQKVRPAEECRSFFAQPTEDILFQLAETACALTAERFIYTMELEEGIATADFFYALLRNHQEVDQIFIDFYKRVDISLMTFTHLFSDAWIAALAMAGSHYVMFLTYQQHQPVVHIFHSFLLLGVASLTVPQLLILVPLYYWYLLVFLRALTWRGFWAGIVGLVLPMCFVLGWSILCDDFNFLLSRIDELIATNIFIADDYAWMLTYQNTETLVLALVSFLSLVSIVHYLRNYYNDKIRTRMYLYIYVIQTIACWLMILFSPNLYHHLAPVFMLGASTMIAHFFAQTGTITSNLFFCLTLLAVLTLFTLNLGIWSF